MTKECGAMEDLIIEYMNGKLNSSDKIILFNHISFCSTCRGELAINLEISKTLANMENEIPEDIMKDAFSKVHEFEKEKESNIYSLESIGYLRELVFDSISTTKKSIKLAFQYI